MKIIIKFVLIVMVMSIVVPYCSFAEDYNLVAPKYDQVFAEDTDYEDKACAVVAGASISMYWNLSFTDLFDKKTMTEKSVTDSLIDAMNCDQTPYGVSMGDAQPGLEQVFAEYSNWPFKVEGGLDFYETKQDAAFDRVKKFTKNLCPIFFGFDSLGFILVNNGSFSTGHAMVATGYNDDPSSRIIKFNTGWEDISGDSFDNRTDEFAFDDSSAYLYPGIPSDDGYHIISIVPALPGFFADGWHSDTDYGDDISQPFMDAFNEGGGISSFGYSWDNGKSAFVHQWPDDGIDAQNPDNILYVQDFLRTSDGLWTMMVLNTTLNEAIPVSGPNAEYWHSHFGYSWFGPPTGIATQETDSDSNTITVQEFHKGGNYQYIGYRDTGSEIIKNEYTKNGTVYTVKNTKMTSGDQIISTINLGNGNLGICRMHPGGEGIIIDAINTSTGVSNSSRYMFHENTVPVAVTTVEIDGKIAVHVSTVNKQTGSKEIQMVNNPVL